jgi:hypothetical protein
LDAEQDIQDIKKSKAKHTNAQHRQSPILEIRAEQKDWRMSV